MIHIRSLPFLLARRSILPGLCVALLASTILPAHAQTADEAAHAAEEAPAAKEIFRQLLENADLARDTGLPLCQDCGLAVFFVEVGEDVRVEGSTLREAINDGMIAGYKDGFLRKSSCDPFTRKNTGDNSPSGLTSPSTVRTHRPSAHAD